MDKRLLISNYSDSDNKLTRAVSFSELPSKKFTYEHRLQTESCGELVRQYSCEEICNKEASTRQFTMSQTVKSNKEEVSETWKYTIPRQSSLKECEWPSISNKGYSIQKQLSVPNQYVTRANSDTRSILAPAKFIIGQNNLRQSQSSHVLSSYDMFKEISSKFKVPSLLDKPTTSTLSVTANQVSKVKIDQIHNKEEVVVDNNNADEKDKKEVSFIQNNTAVKNKQKKDTTELKKTLRSLIKEGPKERSKIFSAWSIVFSILLPIAVINLAFFLNNANISKDFCNPALKIHNVAEELSIRVYGQDEAVNKLIEYFKTRENWTGFDIVALVGGTGVGKSYAFDIIKSNLKGTSNFLDFFPPIFNKEEQAYASLSACRCNVIRLENLKTEDIPDIIHFSNDLRKKIKNYCVIVLAMINPQVTDHNLKRTVDLEKSVSLVEEKLKEAGFQPTVVGFTPISDKALTNCIKDAADYANVELRIEEFDRVKRDLLSADSGCKGAYAKVQIAGKNKQVFS